MSKRLLGNKKEGLLFVVSAPAGTGKSTLVDKLLEEFPSVVSESCSTTTRAPRPGEVAEKHYSFVSVEEFERNVAEDAFLEHANVFGNYYGTRKSEVERHLKAGHHVVLVIDTQGALQIRGKVPGVFVFIHPPSLEELKARLFKRRTEDEATIEKRLKWAEHELSMAPHYDYNIVNDDLEITYQILKSIFIAEEHKIR